MKLDKAIEDVHEAESELATQLRSVGERHASEADLYHLGHTLARQCAEHARRLAPFAERYGAAPPGGRGMTQSPSVLEALRRTGAKLIGKSEASGLLLLRDLRHLTRAYLRRLHPSSLDPSDPGWSSGTDSAPPYGSERLSSPARPASARASSSQRSRSRVGGHRNS